MSITNATFRLKAMVVSGARVIWDVPHARERAAERKIPIFEAERIIRRCSVTEVRHENGQERWCVSGEDADGRPIDVVVSPARNDTGIRVITVIRTDE